MNHAPICVVGNSIAAVSFIETLRQYGNNEDILLLSKEPYPAYGRPLISYLLAGKIPRNKIFLRNPDFYIKNNVHFLPGMEVIDIDFDKRKGTIYTGKSFTFDRLFIATGSKPLIPPIKNMENAPNVFTFTTLQDALDIESNLDGVENVVILGAGLIGLKAAEALSYRNRNISIVQLSDRVLPSVLDRQGAALFQEYMENDGIQFYFQQTIDRIVHRDKVLKGVEMKNGDFLPCDLLLITVGVEPNTGFIDKKLLASNKFISVNRHMQTDIEGIYAAGDVCESYDLIYNTVRHMPLWPNAYWQGRFAGLSILGIPYDFHGHVSMNSIGYKDLPMMSAGIVEDPGLPIEHIKQADTRSYRRFNFQGERLVGMLFVGDVEDKGVLAHLLKHQELVPHLKEKIQNEDFSFLDYPQEYQTHHFRKAHGKE